MNHQNMKIALVVLAFFQAGLCSDLVGFPSYAVIGPDKWSNVHLTCKLESEIDPNEQNVHSWLNPNKLVLAFTATNNNYEMPGVKSGWSSELQEMDFEITSVMLSDDGDYTCQFNLLQASVSLFVNQLPLMDARQERNLVVEKELSTVAKCSAGLSKPPPKIWFEDSKGNEVKSENKIEHVAVGNGLTNSTLSLVKRFLRSDNSMEYYCRIKHVNQTEPSRLPVGKVNVKYPPVIKFTDNAIEHKTQIHPEGRMFEAGCDVEGYPRPNITWSFEPDVKLEPTDDENSSVKQSRPTFPSNFMVSKDGLKIFSQALKLTDGFETNNGTFTCHAANELGSISKSFALQVYELPVTTQAPTTPAMPAGESTDVADVATKMFVKAGPDAAVIGGVVAVAAFVLIITVILLLRYFLSHKGEYYTHELKTNNEDTATDLSDNDDEDDGLPRTEADLLGENKRTEHFL